MEPIPETVEAVEEHGPFGVDRDLLAELREKADRVQALVPSCVGITVSMVREGIAFTAVGTGAAPVELDAVQYVDGGPCVTSADQADVVTFDSGDPTDEQRWELFGRAATAHGVASTLTLPVLDDDGRVTGSVNLYAAERGAFDEVVDEVADAVGGWARGAVLNADLGFATRRLAEQTPAVLQDQLVLSRAAGALALRLQVGVDEAGELLLQAAARAGVPPRRVAELVLDALRHDPS